MRFRFRMHSEYRKCGEKWSVFCITVWWECCKALISFFIFPSSNAASKNLPVCRPTYQDIIDIGRGPTQKCLWLGLFIDAAWEEAHFSLCWSLVREGNKYWISLHERREIEIWIGVANACQCYWLFRIWRMKCIFCVYVCVSVWLMQTVPASSGFPTLPARSYFPITSGELEWHRWSECFKRKSNLKDKPSHSSL